MGSLTISFRDSPVSTPPLICIFFFDSATDWFGGRSWWSDTGYRHPHRYVCWAAKHSRRQKVQVMERPSRAASAGEQQQMIDFDDACRSRSFGCSFWPGTMAADNVVHVIVCSVSGGEWNVAAGPSWRQGSSATIVAIWGQDTRQIERFCYRKVHQPFQSSLCHQIELFCMAGPVLSAASTCFSAGARTLHQLTSWRWPIRATQGVQFIHSTINSSSSLTFDQGVNGPAHFVGRFGTKQVEFQYTQQVWRLLKAFLS